MRKFVLLIAMVFMSGLAFSQSKSVAKFYQTFSEKGANVSLNLSGSFLDFIADDDDDKDALKSITSLRILTFENGKLNASSFKDLLKDVKAEGYEEWMSVKEGKNEEVLFLAKVKGRIITDMVMLVQGDGDYVVMELVGEIDPDKFDDDMNINIDGFEYLKKAKKKNKD